MLLTRFSSSSRSPSSWADRLNGNNEFVHQIRTRADSCTSAQLKTRCAQPSWRASNR